MTNSFVHTLGAFIFLLALSTCSSNKTGDRSTAATCLPESLKAEFEALRSTGKPVSFSRIANAANLKSVSPDIGGSFEVRDGDYLLQNEKIRAVVQQPSRQFALGNYGGTLIAVDQVDAEGTWHDFLGELSTLINLGYMVDVDRVETLRDGRDGVLVVAATGKLARSDWINLEGMLYVIMSSLMNGANAGYRLTLPWSLRDGIPATVSHYYVLTSDSASVTYHTTVCNVGTASLPTVTTDLLDTGGSLSYINLDGTYGGAGFGLTLPLGVLDMTSRRAALVNDLGGYGLRHEKDAAMFLYGGIGIILNGARNLVPLLEGALFGISVTAPPEGMYLLAPGAATVVTRQVIPFRKFPALTDEMYRLGGIDNLATLSGTLTRNGAPVAAARLALINSAGEIETIFTADSNGKYAGRIQTGRYTAYVEPAGGYASDAGSVRVSEELVVEDQTGEVIRRLIPKPFDAEIPSFASLRVEVTGNDPFISSSPTRIPSKISLVCIGGCQRKESRLFRPSADEKFPEGVQMQAFVDQLGLMSVAAKRGQKDAQALLVPPGSYRLVVSRGMEFSKFETDVTLTEDALTTVTATVNRVIERDGWISADLHVHMVNSPDSSIPLFERVLTFAGEGVDVLVTTDHDYVTDIQPAIDALGLEKYVRGVVGEEMTFSDFGHFNAFPLEVQKDQLQNGALDGGGGRGPTLAPPALFAKLREMGKGKDVVVQVNHARSVLFGYFSAALLNTGTLKTKADPESFQMDPSTLKSAADDTGLFSDNFDAFEIYNVHEEINAGLNDYFAFLNLGLRKTGVATSDTHDWYSSEAGAPRSFIYVGAGKDKPATFDEKAFTDGIHAGRLMGTNGPFLRASLVSLRDQTITQMGALADGRDGVRIDVQVDMADWINIDTIDIFTNTHDVAGREGDPVNSYPLPKYTVRADTLTATVINGVRSYAWVVTDVPERDSWYVVVARDDAEYGTNYPMTPVLAKENELPFAFTNAYFADTGGDGKYNHPGVLGKIGTGSGTIPSLAPAAPLTRKEILNKVWDALNH